MPYYIYRVTQLGPVKNLEKLTQFDVFKEASAKAKELRKENDLTQCKIRWCSAKTNCRPRNRSIPCAKQNR